MHGAVASAHPIPNAIGQEVLARGGNAYDALLATSAALAVVLPHANGLGADFFAVVHDGPVRSINASGPAAALATPELFAERGLAQIPTSGPLSALTVPGLVAAWRLLAPRATWPLSRLLEPAVRLARDGFPPSESLRRAARASAPRGDSDWQAVFGRGELRSRFRQPDLGRTLATLQREGPEAFYHGTIARAIEHDAREKGGVLRASDLEAFDAEWTEPLRVRYRHLDVYTTPPNSQGATALIWLNLLARHDLAGLAEADYLAELLRTLPIAYAYRARWIGDPVRLPFPSELLDPTYPYGNPANPPSGPRGNGDTTAFSVTDGTVRISAIQSNYMGFGSGVTVAGTGIHLNNRGCYFTLDPAHHNVLAPGKRTFHTLMALLARAPGTELLLGTMGGDVQPQTNVQVLTRVVDRGQPLGEAIAAPRFAVPATIYGSAPLYAERGLAVPGARPLGADRDLVGHAQGIVEGERTEVGLDPRADGPSPLPGHWSVRRVFD